MGFKHGHCPKIGKSKTYASWQKMKERCYDKSSVSYYYCGARGITVCERWLNSFDNFLADMGQRPEGKTLDRIDGLGNYEPSNCRWATRAEQASNRPTFNRILLFGAITLPLSDMAKKYGLKRTTLRQRLKLGWSLEKALTTRLRKRLHDDIISETTNSFKLHEQ